jgi:predicted outer membrane repeat protein
MSTATESGGAINAENASILLVASSSFLYNTAGASGGAIFTRNSSASFVGLIAKGNLAQVGAALHMASSNGNLRNSTFKDHRAVSGGIIYTSDRTHLNASNLWIVNNSVSLDGGALALASGSSFILSNSTLRQNSAGRSGGNVHATGHSLFEGHQLKLFGGRACWGGSLFAQNSTMKLYSAHVRASAAQNVASWARGAPPGLLVVSSQELNPSGRYSEKHSLIEISLLIHSLCIALHISVEGFAGAPGGPLRVIVLKCTLANLASSSVAPHKVNLILFCNKLYLLRIHSLELTSLWC